MKPRKRLPLTSGKTAVCPCLPLLLLGIVLQFLLRLSYEYVPHIQLNNLSTVWSAGYTSEKQSTEEPGFVLPMITRSPRQSPTSRRTPPTLGKRFSNFPVDASGYIQLPPVCIVTGAHQIRNVPAGLGVAESRRKSLAPVSASSSGRSAPPYTPPWPTALHDAALANSQQHACISQSRSRTPSSVCPPLAHTTSFTVPPLQNNTHTPIDSSSARQPEQLHSCARPRLYQPPAVEQEEYCDTCDTEPSSRGEKSNQRLNEANPQSNNTSGALECPGESSTSPVQFKPTFECHFHDPYHTSYNRILSNIFTRNQYPTAHQYRTIAERYSFDEKRVRWWFLNKRKRLRDSGKAIQESSRGRPLRDSKKARGTK